MKITLLTVGKTTDKQISPLVNRYVDRLAHYASFSIKSLPDPKISAKDSVEKQRQAEAQNILAAISPADHVVLLDERGNQPSSDEFARLIDKHQIQGTRSIVFIVGGPFGFSPEVYRRANDMMALSRMTLTHEMVRLFFVEQLYRAFTIIRGENYHH